MPDFDMVEVHPDRLTADAWRVEAVDAADGAVHAAVFMGPRARESAEQYAAFLMNLPGADDAQKPVDAALLRGAIEAQDERERQAGVKCGVPVEESGCDWPDAVAEEVLSLRAEIARLRALSGAVPHVERSRPMPDPSTRADQETPHGE